MRLRSPNPADELADIRAEIARLQQREHLLLAKLAAGGAPREPAPGQRTGWPIQRQVLHAAQ